MDPPLNIVNLAQKVLKISFVMPYEGLSRKTNLLLGLLSHFWLFLVSYPTVSVIIYQLSIGVDDVFAIIESAIAIFDYTCFIYICICFIIQVSEMEKIFHDIRIFLEFCDVSIIQDAEKDVKLYTTLLVGYFCTGILLNALAPLINISECRESRSAEFLQKYDPCGNISRNLYPFDTRGTFRTTLVNLTKVMGVYMLCLPFLGITVILIGLCIHILAQFKNLKKKLPEVFDGDLENLEEMEEKLNFCIRYHIAIINYTKRVFAVYNMLVLVYISVSSIIVGLILFFISKLHHFIDKVRHAAHLAGWLAMLFIICYYAQQVTDESKSIADAIYSSSWYKAPIKLQKSVCLMIRRAQRPLNLKAVSSCVISLVTFFRVIKTAYSFFAVVVTLSD